MRASSSALWAQMNYEQLTAVFRVEQRASRFLVGEPGQRRDHDRRDDRPRRRPRRGRARRDRRELHRHAAVYLALLGYRREQLGLELDRPLLRAMQRFGWPLVPSALALIAINFSDRLFIAHLAEPGRGRPLRARCAHRVGDGAAPDRVPHGLARLRVLDRGRGRGQDARTPSCSRTSSRSRAGPRSGSGCSRRGSCSCSRRPTRRSGRASASSRRSPSPRRCSPGYIVVSIGIGRARRTGFNWVVTGTAAAINVGLNAVLVREYGMEGAAASAVVAFAVLFVFMAVVRAADLPGAVPVAPGRDGAGGGRARSPSPARPPTCRSPARSRSRSSTRSCCCRSASTCRPSALGWRSLSDEQPGHVHDRDAGEEAAEDVAAR